MHSPHGRPCRAGPAICPGLLRRGLARTWPRSNAPSIRALGPRTQFHVEALPPGAAASGSRAGGAEGTIFHIEDFPITRACLRCAIFGRGPLGPTAESLRRRNGCSRQWLDKYLPYPPRLWLSPAAAGAGRSAQQPSMACGSTHRYHDDRISHARRASNHLPKIHHQIGDLGSRSLADPVRLDISRGSRAFQRR